MHVPHQEAAIAVRPAAQRSVTRPETVDKTYLQESRKLTPEEWSNNYGERMLKAMEVVR
jgi:hypothetical protein